MDCSDTIAAIATPIGSGGIGIVRISGPTAVDIAARVFKPDPHTMAAHTAHHGMLTTPGLTEELDDAVLTLFRAPRSYTGDDVVEISCHGGITTVRAALRAVLDAGARLAEPGEFTQRAFLNGKLDLAQAEAVNDLIRARTDQARKVALRQLDGALSSRVSEINGRVLGVIAALEAAIDFPEDVAEPDRAWTKDEIAGAREAIDSLLASFGKGRIYREGLRVVIAGRVNVGKSSLLNALLRHARAIVTPIPGTTRDLIEESLEIHGIPIVAIDTAGLRATNDPVERAGVELSRESIESADLILLVIDATEGMHQEDEALLVELAGKRVVLVVNKVDLLSPSAAEGAGGRSFPRYSSQFRPHPSPPHSGEGAACSTSATTGRGIEELEARIAEIAGAGELGAEGVVVSNMRHQQALRSASESLSHALATLEASAPIDILSGDLMAARNSLGLITGQTATEDLLDRIFGEFCIGK